MRWRIEYESNGRNQHTTIVNASSELTAKMNFLNLKPRAKVLSVTIHLEDKLKLENKKTP